LGDTQYNITWGGVTLGCQVGGRFLLQSKIERNRQQFGQQRPAFESKHKRSLEKAAADWAQMVTDRDAAGDDDDDNEEDDE